MHTSILTVVFQWLIQCKPYPVYIFTLGEEDAVEVEWMLLYSGEKKKCTCGNWFQIYDIDDPSVHH